MIYGEYDIVKLFSLLKNKLCMFHSSSGRSASRLNDYLPDCRFCRLTRTDRVCMFTLTLLFALMAFFRLGNTYAPQSAYTALAENPDIILDFGDYVDIDSVSLYLNCQSNRHFTLSAYNEVTRKWELFNESAKASSVFTWNKLNVNYNLRYLGLVALENDTVLNELVAVTPEGSVILPVNAGEYPELFDEQEMFPEDVTYMNGTIFDEVYHGRTAYEILHGLPIYETTHPHFGKILISLGIALFGMTPFGMRFMSAIFGILMVPLIYLFAKHLFKNTFCATATAFLLVFDCMHFTLSRIATIDIFAAFFILLMYYLMYRYFEENTIYRQDKPVSTDIPQPENATFSTTRPGRNIPDEFVSEIAVSSASPVCDKLPPRQVLFPLALCGVSMGLGIATKWTGVYAGAGLALLFLLHTIRHNPGRQTLRLFFFCCTFFILIPLGLYVLSFLPVITRTEYPSLLEKVVSCTQDMFRYHFNLVDKHYYSSPFYEWPIIWMPLLAASNAVGAAKVSAVSYMGNPAIWWPGILCCLYVLFRWLIKRDRQAGFLSIAYLAQYVPWMLVPRLTFIYHYFPASIMMLLCIGYTINRIVHRFQAKGRAAIVGYLTIAACCFLMFYPVVSGYPFYKEWGLHLRWLKDWILVL